MNVYINALLLLGTFFVIAAAGPISEETLKDIISKAISQEVYKQPKIIRVKSQSTTDIFVGYLHATVPVLSI